MSRATLKLDIRVGGRAVRMYRMSAPAAFRGLGMKTSKVMVSVASVANSGTEVAVLPVARDGQPISYRQAVLRTELGADALSGSLDQEVLEMAGIELQFDGARI